MEKLCSICKKLVDSESAPILAIGGYGNAKYLCDDCSGDLDTAIKSPEYDKISAALDRLGEKLNIANVDDGLVVETVDTIFTEAKQRAEKIKAGEYDFSLDEEPELTEEDDIAEELKETEEDRLLDEKEAAENKKLDKIYNWVFLAIFLGLLVYLVLERFVFK